MLYVCTGCRQQWSRQSDFVQHLRKSTIPACQRARQALEEARQPTKHIPRRQTGRQHGSSRSPSPGGSNMNSASFEGDFFGNDYANEDFPFPTEERSHPVDIALSNTARSVDEASSDESDSDDADLDEAEANWEAPRSRSLSPTVGHSSAATASTHALNMPDAPVNTEPAQPPADGQDHLRKHPAHVVVFGVRAGEQVSDNDTLQPTYENYFAAVSGTSSRSESGQENEWAPFATRLDWEIARWAKLRGSGSTAFSDLLAIPGVSLNYYQLLNIAD